MLDPRLIALEGLWLVTSSSAGVYPDPANVLLGVSYGPTGTEYTGTMSGIPVGPSDLKYDLATGRFVKILSARTVISL